MNGDKDISSTNFQKNLESFSGNETLFWKIIDLFPYPIQIYAADGTSVMVNQALLKEHHISDASMIVGKYNVFSDTQLTTYSILESVKRVFKGESIQLNNVKFPVEEITKYYHIHDYDVEALYHDITAFPILDDQGKVKYVVSMLIERRIYRGNSEINKGKEYIEINWQEAFKLENVAMSSGFSKSHFTRLFKKHTGYTPHDYYIKIKIDKMREMLCDKSLSISQVFSVCGVDYNGHYVNLFKKLTGQTPSEYRKAVSKLRA